MCGGGGDGSDNDSYSATRPGEEAGGEAQTYRSSMTGVIGSNTGDTRSDQDMENDSRLSEALEKGDKEFKDATTGKTRNVDTYGSWHFAGSGNVFCFRRYTWHHCWPSC